MTANIRRVVERLKETGHSLLAAAVAFYLIAILGGIAVVLSSGEVGHVTLLTASGIGTVCAIRWAVLRVIGRQSTDDDGE